MDDYSNSTLGIALALLLVISGFFSLAETAMMAANRVRLRHQAQRGSAGARTALGLLAKTDRLLGVILLGNNLINAASATLTAIIAGRLFGEEQWALAAGTVAVPRCSQLCAARSMGASERLAFRALSSSSKARRMPRA